MTYRTNWVKIMTDRQPRAASGNVYPVVEDTRRESTGGGNSFETVEVDTGGTNTMTVWVCETETLARKETLSGVYVEVPDWADPDESDEVNHPDHYTSDPSGVECIQITRHRNFNIGNAFKYLWRCGLKLSGRLSNKEKQIQDLRKAVWYIEDEIKRLGETA